MTLKGSFIALKCIFVVKYLYKQEVLQLQKKQPNMIIKQLEIQHPQQEFDFFFIIIIVSMKIKICPTF